MSLTLRPYEPSDAEGVWAVHEAALRESPLPFVGDAPADDDLRTVREAYADGRFLVGTVEGSIVACGAFRPENDSIVEIRRMRVHPDHQRRGYARRLLGALERRAAEQLYERARLETTEEQAAARALYESAGYTPADTREVAGFERTVYTKRLTPAPDS